MAGRESRIGRDAAECKHRRWKGEKKECAFHAAIALLIRKLKVVEWKEERHSDFVPPSLLLTLQC